jgi:hypothetical protein
VETGIDAGDLRLAVKAMEELGADKSVIKDAGQEAAEILLRRAIPLIPVKTGALKSAAKTRRLVIGGGVFVSGQAVPYGNPIHWGWAYVGPRHKGKLKVGTYRGIPPQPFFSEALGYTKDEIFKTYDRLMQDYINRLPGANK